MYITEHVYYKKLFFQKYIIRIHNFMSNWNITTLEYRLIEYYRLHFQSSHLLF